MPHNVEFEEEILKTEQIANAENTDDLVEKASILDVVPGTKGAEDENAERDIGNSEEGTDTATAQTVEAEQGSHITSSEIPKGEEEFSFEPTDRFETSAAERWTEDTQVREGQDSYVEDGMDEGEMYEGEMSEGEPDAKSIEIEIPDLYENVSALTLPELGDEIPKKEAKETEASGLALSPDKSEDEFIEEEGLEYKYYGEEQYEHIEEYEVPIIEKERPKKVEIIEVAPERSDTDLFFNLIVHEEVREEIKEKKLEKKRDPLEESGVGDLLKTVVDDAVEKSERIDPETILRFKLDRFKLMRAFKIVVADIQEEHKKRLLLNSKVVDYFRRKKYNRALAEDNPDTIVETMKRYRQCLLRLDKIKARDAALKDDLQEKLFKLERQEANLKVESKAKVEALNRRLKEVGLSTASIKTGQPMSEKIVDGVIKKMNTLRDQISELRLVFIKAQHRIATLMHEARKLEDIGDGLKMVDFEQLRAETQGLGDKVEERNNELSKLRDRCNADTHFLAHIREKQFMLNQKIMLQDETLSALKDELNYNRNHVNKLKLERDSLRKKYNELSYECGLLDKPNLLHDYDSTVDQIKAVQNRVNNLKESRTKILNELDAIQHKLEKS